MLPLVSVSMAAHASFGHPERASLESLRVTFARLLSCLGQVTLARDVWRVLKTSLQGTNNLGGKVTLNDPLYNKESLMFLFYTLPTPTNLCRSHKVSLDFFEICCCFVLQSLDADCSTIRHENITYPKKLFSNYFPITVSRFRSLRINFRKLPSTYCICVSCVTLPGWDPCPCRIIFYYRYPI